LGQSRKIRDPVHGFISLSEKEAEIVGTRIFQRLRGIRQLALAALVYPGALHTRFDHSLGVCHVSGLLADALSLDPEETKLVRLAALVHDLGHGPFSHVSEYALELYCDRSKLGGRAKAREKIHELVTQDILLLDPDLRRIVGERHCGKIAKLLSSGYGSPVLRGIVSGPLDADKQDYLLRDSFFCGVKYGVFDLQQLTRELRVFEDPADSSRQLMVTTDGVHALEQFVLAKYYLTTQVYRHKVRLITDQMLVRAISLGIEVDGIEELRRLYAYDGTRDFVLRYVEWDDARFLVTFGGRRYRGKSCHSMIQRLCGRNLLKRVFECPLVELPGPARDCLSQVSEPERRPQRKKLERRLAKAVLAQAKQHIDPNFVIAHSYTIKSVRVQSRNDEGPILIESKPRPLPFEEKSTLFRSIDDRLNDAFIEVYAPVSYETPEERERLRRELHAPIVSLLSSFPEQQGSQP